MKLIKKLIIILFILLSLFILVILVNLFIVERRSLEISRGIPIQRYDSLKYALLVIDLQNYTTGKTSTIDSYWINSGDLIRKVNSMIDASERKGVPDSQKLEKQPAGI
jgi:hypothetical protein